MNFSSCPSLKKLLISYKSCVTTANLALRAEELSEFVRPKTHQVLSSEIISVASSLNFAICGKGNSLELSAPIVGTRKNQGKKQVSVSSVPSDSSLFADVGWGAGPATVPAAVVFSSVYLAVALVGAVWDCC